MLMNNSDREPFKSENELRQAIDDWEEKKHQTFELKVYCSFGLLSVIVGLVIHRKRSEWLGLAMLTTGFAELVYWASPSWRGSNSVEFNKLLAHKLVFSFLSLLVLMAIGYTLGLLKRRGINPEQENA
jgi:hypothetical protein